MGSICCKAIRSDKDGHSKRANEQSAHQGQDSKTIAPNNLPTMAQTSEAPAHPEPPMVLVRTTFPSCPLPPNAQRPEIKTARLTIRPLVDSDLQGMHTLRTQPEAMTGTTRGVPDTTMEETAKAMEFFLPPNDAEQWLFGIFWRETGELIGEGGIHNLESGSSGWPEIGYKLRKEFWGKGIATEFLLALVTSWWNLPRSATIMRKVHRDSCVPLPCGEGSSVTDGGREDAVRDVVEHVYANADWDNPASQRVLEKTGFVKFTEWTEPETRITLQGQTSRLFGYRLARRPGAVEG